MDVRGPYRVGAFFLLISAALHILAPLVGGFSSPVPIFVGVGLVYVVIALGRYRGWRWLAYIAFLVMMIGGIIALSALWSPSAIPSWWTVLIIAADWLGAAALFAALWRAAPTGSVSV